MRRTAITTDLELTVARSVREMRTYRKDFSPNLVQKLDFPNFAKVTKFVSNSTKTQ